MDKVAYSKLLDYYGSLLNEHQKEILRQYYDCDMSLQEISEGFEISRQAVSDILQRATKKLRDVDKKLKIIEHSEHVMAQLLTFQDNYLQQLNAVGQTEYQKIIDSVRDI